MICALLIYTWFSFHQHLSCRQPASQSENPKPCVLEDLNATLAYAVQMKCDTNEHCSQCDWSKVYIISPGEVTLEASRKAIDCIFFCVQYRVTLSFSELTVEPVVINVKETNIGGTSGRRLLTLSWEVMCPTAAHCCHPRK